MLFSSLSLRNHTSFKSESPSKAKGEQWYQGIGGLALNPTPDTLNPTS
jgi:hypothetical protein